MKVRIPVHDGPMIVAAKFSGGRSSALACRAAVEAGVADHVVFCNTGLESDETYEFIAAVNEQWLGGGRW